MNCETYYLNLILNRGNVYHNFNNYLIHNDGSGYLKMLQLCLSREPLRHALNLKKPFSKTFDNGIFRSINFNCLPLNKIALLTSTFLLLYKSEINEFLSIKTEFEYSFLTKNYKKAKEILIQSYNKFGMSLWLLDNTSLLKNSFKCDITFIESLSDIENAYYSIFNLKNNLREKHDYYIKRMSEMITPQRFIQPQIDFFKYLLFVSFPTSNNEWKNIIKMTYEFSLIDMYLAVDAFLQRSIGANSNNIILNTCSEYILSIKNIEGSTYLKNEVRTAEEMSNIIELFDNGSFEKVISYFFSNDCNMYSLFGAYKLVALSYIMTNSPLLDQTDICSVDLLNSIVLIIKKENSNILGAINSLAIWARVLRTFQIQKNICLFLNRFAGYNMKCFLQERPNSKADQYFYKYEYETNNTILMPCKSKFYKLNEDQMSAFWDSYSINIAKYPYAQNYFREAYITYKVNDLVSENRYEEATALIVNAYIENKLFVILLSSEAIVNNILHKIECRKNLSLEELCYIFINNIPEFIIARRDCFLDYFDNSNYDSPLELAKISSEPNIIINFFLYYVCNKEMLPKLYRLFNSSEEVDDYRLKICEYLLENDKHLNKKQIMSEIEKITKNRTLSKKLKEVEKSRLTINTDSFRINCFDKMIDEVDAYNNTEPETIIVKAITDGVVVMGLTNSHDTILRNMYDIYCKEFCFGNHGIDMSLSTRVRHGAFSNQILKGFSDNNLSFNGHGSNKYFDGLIERGAVEQEICDVLSSFAEKVQSKLDYFTQHTLKVVFDVPIEGAVFRYDFDNLELREIYEKIKYAKTISIDDVIFVLNDFLVNKTNEYLKIIKEEKLPSLLTDIYSELEELSLSVKKHIITPDTNKLIERLIVQSKTAIQNEFNFISQWFNLSEYNNWEDYSFKELIETCQEIAKTLFAGLSDVDLNYSSTQNLLFNGSTFRHLVDVLLIILNNAVMHSGYKDDLRNLKIKVDVNHDSGFLYLSFENNLSADIDINILDERIKKINKDFNEKSYLKINTRQEGGMGLYKIMYTIFSVLKLGNNFFASRNDKIFRIEIQLKKEILVHDENINS